MITHVVIFWTDKSNPDAASALAAGCASLAQIPGVLNFRHGPPIASPRGAVDDSFASAISMDFASEADAATYQSHPLHQKFLEEVFKPNVKRFVVYDFGSTA